MRKNEPAFPQKIPGQDGMIYGGLTIREYFAIQLTAAMISTGKANIDLAGIRDCVLVADILISELSLQNKATG